MKMMLYKAYWVLPLLLIMIAPELLGQSKKPTVMILPSDNWCEQRYFMTRFEDQGRTVSVPDYQAAFRQDTELGPIVSQIGQILTDYGYRLKDTEQELKKLGKDIAEDAVTVSKSGEYFSESPLDVLLRSSKSDIVIQIGWQVNNERNGKSVSFTLEAFDTYTSKRIATATGISKRSNDIIPRILAKAIGDQIRLFNKQMDAFFSDVEQNGREVSITIRKWDNWGKDLETEFEGEELLDIIQEWLTENAVQGVFNLSDATENFARFEQVRIPVVNKRGVAQDARGFASELRKYLKEAPYHVPAKVMTKGLGEVLIVLGEQ